MPFKTLDNASAAPYGQAFWPAAKTTRCHLLRLAVFASLVFAACGREPLKSKVPPGGLTEEMSQYIALFTKLAAEDGVKITERLYSAVSLDSEDWSTFANRNSLDFETVGLCETLTETRKKWPNDEESYVYKYVTVLRGPQASLSYRSVIFHEFGHCLLNLAHVESKEEIMSEAAFEPENEEHLSAMLHRLFQSVPPKPHHPPPVIRRHTFELDF